MVIYSIGDSGVHLIPLPVANHGSPEKRITTGRTSLNYSIYFGWFACASGSASGVPQPAVQ